MIRNIGWNLFGVVMPVAAALVAIPILIDGYGLSRFGLLSVIWVFVGFFSIFDFGLGRALTKLLSERIGKGEDQTIPNLIATALYLALCISIILGVLLYFFENELIISFIDISDGLELEAEQSFRLMALTIPFVVLSGLLTGALESYGLFKKINLTKSVTGVASFLGPLLALEFYGENLVYGIVTILFVRFVLCSVLVYYLARVLNNNRLFAYDKKEAAALVRFGSWITLGNLLSPIMAQGDKLIVASVVPLSGFSYYSVSADLVNRMTAYPGAIVGVMFPTLSRLNADGLGKGSVALHRLFSQFIAIAVMLPCLIVAFFSSEIMDHWIGREFSANSSLVLAVMAFGFLINSMARVPYIFLQSCGRPDIPVKLGVFQIPFYLSLLYYMVGNYGVIGAAIAWTLRHLADYLLLLFSLSNKIGSKVLLKEAGLVVAAGAIFACAWVLNEYFLMRVVVSILCIGLLMTIGLKRSKELQLYK